MKSKLVAGIVSSALIIGCPSISSAVPVEFDYSGVNSGGFTAAGSFTIDDSLFNGTASQSIPNSNILSLSFTANAFFGSSSFGTSDINSVGSLVFDSSGPTPVLVKGVTSFLAQNGLFTISVLSASQVELIFIDNFTDYNGSWTPASATTPLPATLPLFATGLGALGLFGWRRKKKAAALAA